MSSKNHIPERTCAVCRSMRNKNELIRLTRNALGEVVIDKSGKGGGRGAYVCRTAECVETAARRKTLNRVFKAKLDDDIYAKLKEELRD